MIPSPARHTTAANQWRQLPSGSIRLRLSLLVGILLAVITLGYSLAAYYEMRATALDATKTRLTTIGGEWARFLSTSFVAASALSDAAATDPAIQRVTADPTPANRAAAERVLGARLPLGPQRMTVSIVAPGLHEVARVGGPRDYTHSLNDLPARAPAQPTSAPATTVSELRAVGDSIIYYLETPIVVDGVARGAVVEWRRLTIAPSPDQLNRLVGGTSLHVRLANTSGSVWSDLAHPISRPAIDAGHFGALLPYKDTTGASAFAVAVPVQGMPWSIVVESTRDEMVELARHFLDGLGALGALALLVGVLGAVWLSVSLTRPLNGLIDAIEAVAAGDYTATTGLSQRRDEVGRLARAFDAMVGRLQSAFSSVRGSEERHRRLFEAVPLPCWVFDRETLKIVAVNEAAIKRYGYSRDEFMSMSIDMLRPPEDVARLRAAVDAIDRNRFGEDASPVWRHLTKDGSIIDVEVRSHDKEFEGRPSIIAVMHDLTERRRAAERIARLEDRHSRLIREAPNGVTLATVDGQFIAVNPAFVAMLGYASEEEMLSVNAMDLYADPSQRATVMAKMRSGIAVKREELQLQRKDGSPITIQLSGRIVRDPATGEEYVECVSEDVSAQRRIERQFYQAQKMDAVGRLAGGIAHDFNNLLTVIINYAHFLASDPETTAANREDVESIREAATSAAGLTRQLLSFSRQQVLQPQVMQLNDLIERTGKLLQRLIGEDIELVTALDSTTGLIKADPGQIEQVIVNLAVNARDAMPSGGRLLIESRNVAFKGAVDREETLVPAGDYVMLAVSDTGVGMDQKTQSQIFEPFFTTKPVGKGTGIGLATVYGIVKQSDGFVPVYSEPGRGTSFKIYFPRVEAGDGDEPVAPESGVSLGGSETILLVEDQPEVRRVTHRILERLGYRVLVASSAEEALTIVSRDDETIHLLMSDVVLPDMNGRALSEQVKRIRPAVRVLFMSGYTDDAVVRHGVLEAGMAYIEKPFAPQSLARKVRDVLDASPATPRPS